MYRKITILILGLVLSTVSELYSTNAKTYVLQVLVKTHHKIDKNFGCGNVKKAAVSLLKGSDEYDFNYLKKKKYYELKQYLPPGQAIIRVTHPDYLDEEKSIELVDVYKYGDKRYSQSEFVYLGKPGDKYYYSDKTRHYYTPNSKRIGIKLTKPFNRDSVLNLVDNLDLKIIGKFSRKTIVVKKRDRTEFIPKDPVLKVLQEYDMVEAIGPIVSPVFCLSNKPIRILSQIFDVKIAQESYDDIMKGYNLTEVYKGHNKRGKYVMQFVMSKELVSFDSLEAFAANLRENEGVDYVSNLVVDGYWMGYFNHFLFMKFRKETWRFTVSESKLENFLEKAHYYLLYKPFHSCKCRVKRTK